MIYSPNENRKTNLDLLNHLRIKFELVKTENKTNERLHRYETDDGTTANTILVSQSKR